MRKMLKDYPLEAWIEAADRCESCGAKYEVRIHSVDETGSLGDVEWRVHHTAECPEVTKYYDYAPVTESSGMDVAGWDFMDNVVQFRGLELYPLKSRANIGPCLICGKLVVSVPLILFINEGRGGELDFCFGCAEEKGILEDILEGHK